MIELNDLIKEGIDLRDKTGMSFFKIASILHEKYNISDSSRTINQTQSIIYNNHKRRELENDQPALMQACDERGIDPSTVGLAWNKDKKWSIRFKPSNNGPSFDEMLKDHIDDVKSHTFNYEKIKRTRYSNPCLLVVDPADIHIGKLASSFETGEDYNNQIAVQRVRDGVNGIIQKAEGFDIEKIVFIAGNDILHIDTPRRTTTAGTPQDTDGMWYNNFLIAKKLYIEIIDKLMLLADVHVMYNPSNHDYTNGFFLADSISAWYNKCENVTFDVSISHRKYFQYGNNLIGTTHGDGAKVQDLPLLMAQEADKMWSESKHRYVYMHHVHHKISKDYIGVTVEALRSPSGTDSWHHRKGYQHSPKAVEGFIHEKSGGQIARFTHLF